MAHAGTKRGQGNRRETVLVGDRENGARRTSHHGRVGLKIRTHHGGVDDVSSDEISAGGENRVADLDRPLPGRFLLDDDAALSLDGGRHTGGFRAGQGADRVEQPAARLDAFGGRVEQSELEGGETGDVAFLEGPSRVRIAMPENGCRSIYGPR